MTRSDYYDLERTAYKMLEELEREQEKYLQGVSDGIDLVLRAVRERVAKEELSTEDLPIVNDCSNCGHKSGSGTPAVSSACANCISSYDRITGNQLQPSHWIPKEGD